MQYALVATPKYLLCVDLITKKATPIEIGRGEYYGISWFPNQEQLILSHSALDNSTLIDVASYAQSEVGYISAGKCSIGSWLYQCRKKDKQTFSFSTSSNRMCS
ncbi:protein of unknown function [Legionella fallonii LLAP-10]|uniref:Uncharacterized protein n=1 Tax=Legionella fallonii LLAP-10 TaxID=1212491 RepID=A0A098G2L3_9GAMM|nr:protein of unknown function [Legionella fallonii LLAP-10]